MNLNKKLIGFSLATVIALSGCSMSQPTASEVAIDNYSKQDPNKCYEGGVEAPNWICNPTLEGATMTAVGTAPWTGLGRGMQQTEALANARDQFARQMGTKVKNMFKNFSRVTGVGENQSVEKVASDVSRQISQQNIVGAVQKNSWVAPDKTLFVLVALDKDSIQSFVQETKKVIKTSLKNDEALYQQFQAKNALDELDKQIDKEMGSN